MTGTVKKIVKDKGFGFIRADDGTEYFFHRSALASGFEEMREGDAVSFDVGRGPKGPRAEDVRVV